jgi:hypothetical protein
MGMFGVKGSVGLSAQSHGALTGRPLEAGNEQAAEARQSLPLVRFLARGDPAVGDDVRPLPRCRCATSA